jgi:hypothetical protein
MMDEQAKQNMNQVAALFDLMLNSLARMEQKVDHLLNMIEHEYDEDELDDANLTPFGRERNGNDVL